MIPILYPMRQTVFTKNGYGPLSDAISCKCTEKLNGKYEVELKIPRTGQHVDEINIDCTLKVKPNYEDDPQIFRIYSVEKNYDDTITVKAAHITYDTSGIPVLPFTSQDLDDAVNNMNTNRVLLSDSLFVINAEFSAEGTLEVKSPTSFRSLLGGSDNSIIGVYGGEYHYDNYMIKLVEKRGTDKGVCFRYSKNISDFNQETSSEELYTAVLGYWKKSGNDNEPDTIIYGDIIQCEGEFPYDKILVLDTTSSIKTENDAVATVDQINECVNEYIFKNSVGIPKTTIKIDYSDDDNIIKVCLGDRVGVLYPEYNINTIARCNTVVFDCLSEKNESIEIGVESKKITDTISDLAQKASASNSGTSPSGRLQTLWTGSWASGNITVDGISRYTLFIVRMDGQGTQMLVTLNGQYFRGMGGYVSSSTNEVQYYLNATLSGDILTMVSCHSMQTNGTRTAHTVTRIIGII